MCTGRFYAKKKSKEINPSASPFRKGRNKNEKIFLIPIFFKDVYGEILCKKEKQRNKSLCVSL
jgi:hypothetical protein